MIADVSPTVKIHSPLEAMDSTKENLGGVTSMPRALIAPRYLSLQSDWEKFKSGPG